MKSIGLAGYQLQTLSSEGELVLLRAVPEQRDPPTPPMLLLLPASERPAPASIALLEHIWALRDQLDTAWAARPRALEHHNGHPLLLLDDPGGEPLSRLLGRPLELTTLLRLAIGLSVAIGRLHQRGLVHTDIKPTNILVDPLTGEAWLVGLGIASRRPRERKGPGSLELISGTLAYIAPEQTGRMNRSIDSRSDLYSVGITLYELLAGALPFSATAPMEWVHCHIAREPPPLSKRPNGEKIPAALAGLVLKLLAKAAEDRYQTAAGLEFDLRRCLAEWKSDARIELFPLGKRDSSERLLLPEKLYGREREIGALRAAFERMIASGKPALVLVSGYSGVGKSSIVSELQKVLVATGALFATGKCDEFKRDVPYGTLAQAFQNVVREILGKSDAEVSSWREAMRDAIAASGQLIVNLIPELELIIGEQPALSELPARDAQNRFQLVFQRFVGAVARPEHPLVLFLDDLQWLDTATLDLAERLITGSEVGRLLLIGAYRDNEIHSSHPLQRKLDLLRGAGAPICELVLEPLGQQHVSRLIEETLRCGQQHAEPLTDLVYRKTGGNPFFTIQFIGTLAEEGLLAFDSELAIWTWNLPRIQAKGFSDNVADLMVAKLSRLPDETRASLAQLACLGNAGAMTTLTLVLDGPEDAIHERLWEAVRLGLIVRSGGEYRFLHDRAHEAAYTLISETERAAEHLRIARLLSLETELGETPEQIFAVVNHFNRGAALIESREERERVAGLNLMAGKRARESTASAHTYFAVGRSLLDEDSWESQYDLAFALELQLAECELLTGGLSNAEERLSALAARAMNTVDRGAVTRLRLELYTTMDRSDRSVEVCLEFLRSLGVDWSLHPAKDEVQREFDQIRNTLGSRAIEEFVDAPRMADPESRAVVEVLAVAVPPAWFTDTNLLCLVVGRMSNLSLSHGNCDASAYGYAVLANVLKTYFADFQAAFHFGKLAFDLVETRGLEGFRGRVYLQYGYDLIPWTNKHMRTGLAIIRRGFEAACEVGDLLYASFSWNGLIENLLATGEPLDQTQKEAEAGLAFARKMRFGFSVSIIRGQLILIRMLRGLTRSFSSFDDDEFDEVRFEQELTDPNVALGACWYWIHKLQARVFAGDHVAALAAADRVEPLLWTSQGHFVLVEYSFYCALAHAARASEGPAEERPQHLQALALHHQQLQTYARNSPANIRHRAVLVAAEVARVEGRDREAMHLYEEGARLSFEHGSVHNEGLVHELAGRFYAKSGLETLGLGCLRNARGCYLRWGALGKVAELDRRYADLRDERGASASTVGATVGQLDVAAVVEMSHAVSGEIVLESLIEKLMVIAVEHAGATRGLLILPHRDGHHIEAEATSRHEAVMVRHERTAVSSVELPESVLRFVMRAHESVLLDDASVSTEYSADEYVVRNRARSVLCFPLIRQANLIGVLYLENNLTPHAFTRDRIAILELLTSQAAISLENARLYAELQESDTYLAEAQRLSRTGSFGWNVETGELRWSDETFQIYGFDRALKPSIALLAQRTHPDDRAVTTERLQLAVRAAKDWELEYRLLMPNGSVKNLRLVARAVRENAAELRYVGAIMDVTEAKRAEERLQASLSEKQALLKEVHHRVKNNLQLISSLLNLQARRSKDPAIAELFVDSRNRVRSMALVHENLYRAGDFGKVSMAPHIQTLCAHLTRVYAIHDRAIELSLQLGDCQMDLDRAVSCGLLVNELVSNALKHAFPGGRPGRVRVELTSVPGGGLELVVDDDGVGLPPDVAVTQGKSLGLQLVDNLTRQLRGQVNVKRSGGTSFSIVFGPEDPVGART